MFIETHYHIYYGIIYVNSIHLKMCEEITQWKKTAFTSGKTLANRQYKVKALNENHFSMVLPECFSVFISPELMLSFVLNSLLCNKMKNKRWKKAPLNADNVCHIILEKGMFFLLLMYFIHHWHQIPPLISFLLINIHSNITFIFSLLITKDVVQDEKRRNVIISRKIKNWIIIFWCSSNRSIINLLLINKCFSIKELSIQRNIHWYSSYHRYLICFLVDEKFLKIDRDNIPFISCLLYLLHKFKQKVYFDEMLSLWCFILGRHFYKSFNLFVSRCTKLYKLLSTKWANMTFQ